LGRGPRRGNAGDVSVGPDYRRALGLAAGYIWERLDCGNEAWGALWGQIERARAFDKRTLTKFRNPSGDVSENDIKVFHKIMEGLVRDPSKREKVIEDYGLKRPG